MSPRSLDVRRDSFLMVDNSGEPPLVSPASAHDRITASGVRSSWECEAPDGNECESDDPQKQNALSCDLFLEVFQRRRQQNFKRRMILFDRDDKTIVF